MSQHSQLVRDAERLAARTSHPESLASRTFRTADALALERTWQRIPVLLRTTLATVIFVAGCSRTAPSVDTGPPRVVVESARVQHVRDQIELDGTVAVSSTVNLVARVAGTLQAAPFAEGTPVRRGQQLFAIEPDAYIENVKLNAAKVEQARADEARQTLLLQENATSQSNVESARSQREQAEANLELARINLGYTEIRAPFDGVIGRRYVDVGNYVGASAGGTTLATVVRLRPVFVNFALGERDLLRLRSRVPSDQKRSKAAVGALHVRVSLPSDHEPSEIGTLDFVDNAIASNTGTIPMRAVFANDDLRLIPGMYARVTLDTSAPREALLVPSQATLSAPEGPAVFVVTAAGIARRRAVKLGQTFAADIEVLEGLNPDDKVVVEGSTSLVDGVHVIVAPAGRQVP